MSPQGRVTPTRPQLLAETVRAPARLGHSRKTVAKALAYRIPPGYRLSEPRAHPVIDPVKGIIDAWLEQNVKTRPKQRQTARKIYERLQDECGFTGHYGTVQRYVKEAAHRQKEVFMPLKHPPGEVQVDFGHALVKMGGVLRKVSFFMMTLPYSDAFFVRAYERECTETFWDGHVRAFAFLAGSLAGSPMTTARSRSPRSSVRGSGN